jgi:hypothetical protein
MTEAVKVVVRVRPLISIEAGVPDICTADANEVTIVNPHTTVGKTFAFDAVYAQNST